MEYYSEGTCHFHEWVESLKGPRESRWDEMDHILDRNIVATTLKGAAITITDASAKFKL
jgi:hypothetical protein